MSEKIARFMMGEGKEDPEREPVVDIINFIRFHNLTGADMTNAYELAMGVDESDSSTKEEVKELAEKMEAALDGGVAVNRLTELIALRGEYEQHFAPYFNIVDALKIPNEDKNILRTLLMQGKSGALVVMDKESGRELDRYFVTDELAENPREYSLANILAEFLSKYRDRDIGVRFE